MADEPSGSRDELAGLRAASARLRQVVQAKDTEIAALRAALEAGQGRQAELIRRLERRIAELERRLGMDSANSSKPPAKEQLGAGLGYPAGQAGEGALAAAGAALRWLREGDLRRSA